MSINMQNSLVKMTRVKEKNIENRVGRGLWRLYSLYSASRIQLCLCHLGKHLSNSSLEAHSDRDCTIIQGNLFPRLVILADKGGFLISNLNFCSCNLSVFLLVLFPRTWRRDYSFALCGSFFSTYRLLSGLLFCRLNKPNSFSITV